MTAVSDSHNTAQDVNVGNHNLWQDLSLSNLG